MASRVTCNRSDLPTGNRCDNAVLLIAYGSAGFIDRRADVRLCEIARCTGNAVLRGPSIDSSSYLLRVAVCAVVPHIVDVAASTWASHILASSVGKHGVISPVRLHRKLHRRGQRRARPRQRRDWREAGAALLVCGLSAYLKRGHEKQS